MLLNTRIALNNEFDKNYYKRCFLYLQTLLYVLTICMEHISSICSQDILDLRLSPWRPRGLYSSVPSDVYDRDYVQVFSITHRHSRVPASCSVLAETPLIPPMDKYLHYRVNSVLLQTIFVTIVLDANVLNMVDQTLL